MCDDAMGPPPYELALLEHPEDRAEFNDWVAQVVAHSRPGFRFPPLVRRWRRREARENWERRMRIFAGRIYTLGRR